ncbi:sialic acid synthase-like isoform X8 [Limulus polyphemus]|uniref:Sialic acid synthase-like isoform X8 n=1 Tax=Limulus polyphemus TaxID=6850 RepID=A0ABM1T8M9_LIMPO|nr:sialic acid synthase-like isoform X8 [Limulus polyphemus]
MASFELVPGCWVGGNCPCFIIAEIGQNHQGDINIAKNMIEVAKKCGANCVKFQKSDLNSRFNKAALDRPYTSHHSWGNTYGQHRAHLEFSESQFKELKKHAERHEIIFSASGMDMSYQEKFPDVVIGYSGHETGTDISIAAVALGAKILERHLTLDKTWKGSDHCASLDPEEFQQLVSQVRNVETALGSHIKIVRESEIACYRKLGKTLVASQNLQCGTVLSEDMLDIKVSEPKGLNADQFYNVIGHTLIHDKEYDDSIFEEDIS